MLCVERRLGLVINKHLTQFKSRAARVGDILCTDTVCKADEPAPRLAVSRNSKLVLSRLNASGQPIDVGRHTRRWQPASSSVACTIAKVRKFTSAEMQTPAKHEEGLSAKEASLVQLFIAASLHLWEQLPGAFLNQASCIVWQTDKVAEEIACLLKQDSVRTAMTMGVL